jgi:hypothetical protein
MKITATKTNRDENGSRAEFFGSNPHSNGELFSRSSLIFFDINVASIMMAVDSKMAPRAVVVETMYYLRNVIFVLLDNSLSSSATS